MRKGDIVEGVIKKIDFPNKGYLEIEDAVIIVKNAIPGQRVKAMINKKRGGRLEARLLEVIEQSPLQKEEPLCNHFPQCGGCMYQTMAYEDQLQMKADQLENLLGAAIKQAGQTADYDFEGVLPSPSYTGYRNKMEFSFGDSIKGGPLCLGLHKKGSTYDIITTDDCKIVHNDFCKVLQCVLDYFKENPAPFYHKMQHTGYLRHLLVRRSATDGTVLVCLVTTSQESRDLSQLTDRLINLSNNELEGKIGGILHIVNDSLADVVQSDETHLLYGEDFFYETILGLRFKITPFSFFQTNSKGAEVLYSKAREYIGNTQDKVVYDLYSGTGTIAQILASVAKKVIGVEIVEEAVVAAKENAGLNGLTNCEFLAGDVLQMLDEISSKPDYIVLDPPREGIHPKALKKIIDYGVPQMVYISCKPTSLARDLQMLIGVGYQVEKICGVDMFPGTVHTETIALLTRIK